MFRTPVVLIVFNRPELAAKSFECVRAIKPIELFVISDGPRENNTSDIHLCEEVEKVVREVDWDCKTHYIFSETNLGLKERVRTGLNYVFDRVDKAIILEDDCIPHEDFFGFCNDLLEKYNDDSRVSVITGNNFQKGNWRGDASYYFSRYNHCWGWATWKRAWELYDRDISFWPTWKISEEWKKQFTTSRERKYWEHIFEEVYQGKKNSWAYPWTACVWKNNGLTATPNVNLVTNVGFDEQSTHTTSKHIWYANMPVSHLGNVVHPNFVNVCKVADEFTFGSVFSVSSVKRVKNKLINISSRFLSIIKK